MAVEPGLDYDRFVQVWATGHGTGRGGSGYLIADGLVLTTGHLVADLDQTHAVRPLRGEQWQKGRVLWFDIPLNAALLALDNAERTGMQPAVFADASPIGEAFQTLAFPGPYDPKGPHSSAAELISGTVLQDSGNPDLLKLVLADEDPRTGPTLRASPVPGLEGAALLSAGAVLGLVNSVETRATGIHAVRATRLAADERFTNTLALHLRALNPVTSSTSSTSDTSDTSDSEDADSGASGEAADSAPSATEPGPQLSPPEAPGKSAPDKSNDQVEWVPDIPADRDLLNRAPIATMIAQRLRRLAKRSTTDGHRNPGSFLVHLDGPWGAGKTSILNFLRKDLEQDKDSWMVVDINAWQQLNVGPPWWTLLTGLRGRVVRDLRWGARVRLRVAEARQRVRVTGAPYALALALAVAIGGAVVLAVGPAQVFSAHASTFATTLTAILAALSAVWAGLLIVSRFFLWDSPVGARLFEQSNRDPRTFLREQFAWLARRAGRPVVFFIDDLDRCERQFVVELLDGIQTLVRDAGAESAPPGQKPPQDAQHVEQAGFGGPFFVIAADGNWIRACYQEKHADLAAAVGRPGQSLGYLFLDKLFQLTVTVPSLSAASQGSFLQSLLADTTDPTSSGGTKRSEVEQAIRASTTQAEVQQVWRDADAQVREEVAPLAVAKLTEPAVEARTEHQLQKFAELLDRNPRRIKRFLNTYTAELVTSGLDQSFPDPDSLALWTIVRMRWPTIADRLAANPDHIASAKKNAATALSAEDPELAAMLRRPEFIAVRDFKHGGPLTSTLVEQLTGISRG